MGKKEDRTKQRQAHGPRRKSTDPASLASALAQGQVPTEEEKAKRQRDRSKRQRSIAEMAQ